MWHFVFNFLILLLCLQDVNSWKLTKPQKDVLKKIVENKEEIKEKFLKDPEFLKMIQTYATCSKPMFPNLFDIKETNKTILKSDHPLIGATTPQIVMYYGYIVETHYIQTEDGYILEIHRIPCPKNGCEQGEVREAVVVQHGILCSSADWVVNLPHQALGFLLADAGYDVWLTNLRGNTYGKKHTHLDPDSKEFWMFSWDEMGEYDLPAYIDYILGMTGFDQLYYIGHSMGTTSFFAMAEKKTEYNDKVRAFFALAPAATLDNMGSPLSLLGPFVDMLEWLLLDLFGIYEFMPEGPLMTWIAKTFCDDDDITQFICSNVMFLLGGYNEKQLNTTMLPVYISLTPAGSSTKAMVHFAQIHNSAIFRDYDYGEDMNIDIYGNTAPPLYDLSKVTTPTYLYWGENDWMTDPIDVMELAAELGNLRAIFRVDDDKYTHLDFMWGIGSRSLLYDCIIKEMSHMSLPFSSKSKVPLRTQPSQKQVIKKSSKKVIYQSPQKKIIDNAIPKKSLHLLSKLHHRSSFVQS